MNLMRAEHWITEGRSLLGLKEKSAGWIACLYRDGAVSVEVDISGNINEVAATRIELPEDPVAQKKLLIALVAYSPADATAVDKSNPNSIWLFRND